MSATLDDLLDALAGVPRLADAACSGRGGMFDERRQDETREGWHSRTERAVSICGRCPALAGCRDWLQSLTPARRPHGVVAGLHVDPQGRIRRKHPDD